MMKMEMKYHDQSTHGDLMSRFTNDLELVSEGLNSTASSLVINFLTLMGTMILMFLLSPQLALISLVILPLLFLIARVIVKKSRYYVRQELETMGDLNAFLEESMEGMSFYKSMETIIINSLMNLMKVSELNRHYRKLLQC